jgi:hypothetical protein
MEKNTFIPKNTMNTLNKEIIKPKLPKVESFQNVSLGYRGVKI